MNNTYSKFCPNVFLAKCPEQHAKGDVITMTTKYGQEHEVIVFNLIYEKEGNFYYSIIRADGFNFQEWANRKAKKYNGWSGSLTEQSNAYYKRSHEATKHIPMGQPILVGHHSEKRHRSDLQKSWNAMRLCVEASKKADDHKAKAEYWSKKASTINLSMPESIDYYEYKLTEATKIHEGLKNGTIQRQHSYSLAYAKRDVKEMAAQLALAIRLWGEHK